MLGLDGAGATTLLYRLKLGEVITTISTIGFNVEDVRLPTSPSRGKLDVEAWDFGACHADLIESSDTDDNLA